MCCCPLTGLLFIVQLLCYLEASGGTSEQSILLRDNGGHPTTEDEDIKVKECDHRQQSHDHSEANGSGSDSDQVLYVLTRPKLAKTCPAHRVTI